MRTISSRARAALQAHTVDQVTFDVADTETYIILAGALEDYAHRLRGEIEDERDTDNPNEHRIGELHERIALTESMLARVEGDDGVR